ncbi:nuclear transport factor 2 family protein [Larkinella sp.]|uniref:nuclear transport factor 2 family protein n=1 Tax=Larkinella sp. TaxID=2034517 RepID=UPI003BAD3797
MKSFLFFCGVLISSYAYAQPSSGEKVVLDIEKQRFEAQVTKNYAVLEKVLGDDLIYNHSNGNQDTKQSFIQSIRDGKQSYDAIEMLESKVLLYGNTAVVSGICQVKAANNGQTINTKLRYTDVYVKKGTQWQMVAWQSLKLAN